MPKISLEFLSTKQLWWLLLKFDKDGFEIAKQLSNKKL